MYERVLYNDLTGQKFGEWTVLGYVGNNKWRCQCSCGIIRDIEERALKNGRTKSCGHGNLRVDLTGMQFGELTVIRYAGNGKWLCRCSCGVEKEIRGKNLRSGNTKTCGDYNHRLTDLTGMQFGEWTVLGYAGNGKWKCQCSCGVVKDVDGKSLREGKSKSCGHERPKIDLTGMKFGEWTVLGYAGDGKWTCQCSCGTIRDVYGWILRRGESKSCGHGEFIDLTGKKFGEWTVLRYAGNNRWVCQCSCGVVKEVLGQSLRDGTSKSCGHVRPKIDLTGMRFGELTVIKYVGDRKWLCRCSCGVEKEVDGRLLRSGEIKSCGNHNFRLIDLTGMRFGEWTVIEYVGDRKWRCRCSCGKMVEVDGNELRRGETKSCGHSTTAYKDITGMKFGHWTALYDVGNGYWMCRCSCGVERTVSKYHLLSGRSRSCGHTNKGGFVDPEYIRKQNENRRLRVKRGNIHVGDIIGEWEVLERKENSYWLCRCSCGKEKLVHDWHLKIGKSLSCGHSKLENLTGKIFGEWTVIEYAGGSKWKCKCSCGVVREVRKTDLINGASKSCGHDKNKPKIDLTGRRFGFLTVLEYVGETKYKCLCDCGNITYVRGQNLLSGNTIACGCKRETKYTREYLLQTINNFVYATGELPSIGDLADILAIHRGYVGTLIKKYDLSDKINRVFRSKYEKELYQYINEISPNMRVVRNTRDEISGIELDIYIPDKKLAIEFDGTYWHSDINKDWKYHQRKTILCAKHGIRLIHIFEYEWLDEITKNKLKQLLRRCITNDGIRIIDARDCEIKRIESNEADEFLNTYNLYNTVEDAIHYGLIFDGELASVMSFSKHILNDKYDRELLRYCEKFDVRVVGGAEKLFNYAISQLEPKFIVIYCDISKFTGNVYTKLGFRATIRDITEPKFRWVYDSHNSNDVIDEKDINLDRLLKEGYGDYGDTIDEIMENRGYVKVYNSGYLRLTWSNEH